MILSRWEERATRAARSLSCGPQAVRVSTPGATPFAPIGRSASPCRAVPCPAGWHPSSPKPPGRPHATSESCPRPVVNRLTSARAAAAVNTMACVAAGGRGRAGADSTASLLRGRHSTAVSTARAAAGNSAASAAACHHHSSCHPPPPPLQLPPLVVRGTRRGWRLVARWRGRRRFGRAVATPTVPRSPAA